MRAIEQGLSSKGSRLRGEDNDLLQGGSRMLDLNKRAGGGEEGGEWGVEGQGEKGEGQEEKGEEVG